MPTPSLSMQNYFSTTLTAGITSSDTVLFLTQLPTASEGYLELDEGMSTKEIVYYTSKGANFVTCPSVGAGRGVGGTSAAAHSLGAVVKQKVNAEYWLALQDGSALSSEEKGGWHLGTSTWVYVSATTLTVSSTEAASISVGTRLKLTQTSTKYFYVVGVSGTTLTVTGGSDYTLASAAITSPSFSNASCPPGFPDWFNYTPTFVGFSANPTSTFSQFRIVGHACTITHGEGGDGTSNSTAFTLTLPVTAATVTNGLWQVLCSVANAGSFAPGVVSISSGGTLMGVGKDVSNNTFTNSGAKRLFGVVITYAI